MALGTLPGPPHHQLVPGPPEAPAQPGDPAPPGPAHPHPPGEVGRQHPAGDALAIQETFRRLGKDNLTVHIYPDAGHALGFERYLATGELPPP